MLNVRVGNRIIDIHAISYWEFVPASGVVDPQTQEVVAQTSASLKLRFSNNGEYHFLNGEDAIHYWNFLLRMETDYQEQQQQQQLAQPISNVLEIGETAAARFKNNKRNKR